MLVKLGILHKVRWGLVAIGLISMAFGWFSYVQLPSDAHDMSMLMGMFFGLGAAFLVVGIVTIIRRRHMSPDQLKQQEIARKDERTAAITGKAFIASGVVAFVFNAAAAFVLVGLGYRTAAYISIGGLYAQMMALMIAGRYFEGRM